MYTSFPLLAIFRIRGAVDREKGDILIDGKRSVLFWLNFSLAKMLKDRLGDEIDIKLFHCQISGEKQVDVTNLEEKNGRRVII